MMAPILAELEQTYAGRLGVTFVDVWKDPAAGQPYGIMAIPTQVFLDPDGNELFRHEGFFSRAQILETWRRLGYDLMSNQSPPSGPVLWRPFSHG